MSFARGRVRSGACGAAVALLVCALSLSCTSRGAGMGSEEKKRRQVILSTAYDDRRAGDEAAAEIEAELGISDDQAVTKLVEKIGRRLLRHAPRQPFEYSFQVVDQSTPNAFALPGGHIYVSRGLIALTNSEDELAGVIGHEITHAAERHAAGRQERARRLNPLSMGYMRAAIIAQYGRDQERDADRGGQKLAAQAGYDPAGLATFLQDLGHMERLKIGWSRLPTFFDTHPGTPERAATAAARAEQLEWARKPGESVDRETYLYRLEGLIVGPNPAEGVFEGSRFLHPELAFTISLPQGWETVNTHSAVGAVSPKGDAQAVLQLAGRGDDPKHYADEFISNELPEVHGKVESEQALEIGGLPAYRIRGRSRSPAGALAGDITWIAYRGLVYEITTTSLASAAKQYTGRFLSAARSFRALTADEAEQIQVMRLRVARAEAGDSWATLGQRSRNALDIPTTAVLNHLFVTSTLSEGQLVKIAIAETYRPKPREEQAPAAEGPEVGGREPVVAGDDPERAP